MPYKFTIPFTKFFNYKETGKMLQTAYKRIQITTTYIHNINPELKFCKQIQTGQ